jgi:hypothetical protein
MNENAGFEHRKNYENRSTNHQPPINFFRSTGSRWRRRELEIFEPLLVHLPEMFFPEMVEKPALTNIAASPN